MAVPNVPGVPPLTSFSSALPVLLVADTIANVSRSLQPLWGIYLDGAPVLASSLASLLGLGGIAAAVNSVGSLLGAGSLVSLFSVIDFEYRQDWSISDYPVEQGAFLSYDKVQHPFDVRMRVAAGGSRDNRQALIDAVTDAANTLDLYDVVTPERVYSGCNINHFDYKRMSDRGVGIVVVDVWLTEVRVTAASSFSSTAQNPVTQGPRGLGNLQPQAPTPGQQSYATSGSFF